MFQPEVIFLPHLVHRSVWHKLALVTSLHLQVLFSSLESRNSLLYVSVASLPISLIHSQNDCYALMLRERRGELRSISVDSPSYSDTCKWELVSLDSLPLFFQTSSLADPSFSISKFFNDKNSLHRSRETETPGILLRSREFVVVVESGVSCHGLYGIYGFFLDIFSRWYQNVL